jgi:ABC-type sugar transport system permease subunit
MASETPPGESKSRLLMRPLNRLEMLSEQAYAYVLLIPAAILLGIIAFYPLVRTFTFSLRADGVFTADPFGPFIGLENYVELLSGQALIPNQFIDPTMSEPLLQQALIVTVLFAVLSVLFETLIGFGQALILNQDFRGRRWVRVAIIIPWAVPVVIQAMIFWLMFNPTIGWGTEFMQWLGVFGDNPLANTSDSFIIVLVADIWKTAAFMALLILAGLQSVDRSLYEVARVSGASPWQRFKFITMPIVMPALLVAMLFRTMDAMRIYGLIDASAGCETVPTLTCLVITSFNGRRWASASAVAFLTALVIGIMVLFYIWQFRKTEGGAV